MKKLTVLICATLISVASAMAQNIDIDAINFPDVNFRNYLLARPYGSDAILTPTEIAGITNMSVSDLNISDLTGIEFFTALNTLSCDTNQLISLDVSNNTALEYLSCRNNQLTSLDVSECTALTILSCYNNQLTSLDVSNNTALQELYCNSNKLISLDVSTNTALTILNCSYNQLTSLDVGNNTELQELYCNNNQLTSLDVSNNTELQNLTCHDNQLTNLDVSGHTALQYLDCWNNQLTSLDVSNNTALQELYCNSNQLTSLDVSTNTALTILNCSYNQLTSLDVSNNTALQTLYCNNNQLTSLDVSGCTALETLSCRDNQLTSLDVSECTTLETLSCRNNQLTSLDVSNNTALQTLYCSDNYLPLSELYFASTMIATQNNKQFGFQQLSPVAAIVGKIVDWSPLPAQNIFNGNYTTYDVRTGSSYTGTAASTSDYTVSNGNITFNTAGTYTVIMKNASVECNVTPALQVVATITVICDPSYVPVTDISSISSCTTTGNMELNGMVTPSNATKKDIVWSVVSGSASITGTNNDILSTTSSGNVTVRATISNGLWCGSDYTQDFNINVLEPVTNVTYTPGVASTGNSFTLGVGLTITPSTITDYVVAWQVVNAGTTGAKIGGNILKATAGGTVTVRVYVIHNACGYVMFTKDISITVNDGCCN